MATKSPASAPKKLGNFAQNRKLRLERTLKDQPNNKQVQLALTENPNWVRKAPNTPYWSHSMIKEAKLIKEFTGKMDIAIFSNIESISAKTRIHIASDPQLKAPEGKVNFTLGARAHNNQGVLVWG